MEVHHNRASARLAGCNGFGVFVPRLVGALSGGPLATLFTVAVSMVLLPTVYASFYVSYRDVFGSLRDAD